MPKLALSFNGRQNHQTWDITQQEEVFSSKAHLTIERGTEVRELAFETESDMRCHNK